jgi:hypothetical protein
MRGRPHPCNVVLPVVLLGAVVACAPAFELRVPGVRTGRIAAGPAIVAVFEFDANGGLTPHAEWTRTAAKHVDAAVAARAVSGGGRRFVPEDVAHTDVTYGDFRRWSNGALQEIANKHAGRKPSPHRSVGDWRFPASLTTWRAALGVDFVVAVVFIDAYQTAMPATARYQAAQTGIACTVDLADGRIVSCQLAPAFGDLRTRDGVDAAVGELLR